MFVTRLKPESLSECSSVAALCFSVSGSAILVDAGALVAQCLL
jgi:hypothetical protein